MVVVTLASAYQGGLDFDECIRDGALEVLVRMESTSQIVASGDPIGEATLRAGFYDLRRVIAASLGATLTDVCFSCECWWLRPHAKTQVTIEYVKHADGSVAPSKIHTIIISAQHVEPMTSALGEELERDTFVVQTAPSLRDMHNQIIEKVVKRTLSTIILESGKSALTLYGNETYNYMNSTNKSVIGDPEEAISLLESEAISMALKTHVEDELLPDELVHNALLSLKGIAQEKLCVLKVVQPSACFPRCTRAKRVAVADGIQRLKSRRLEARLKSKHMA